MKLYCLVEGAGEVDALPHLLGKIGASMLGRPVVAQCFRVAHGDPHSPSSSTIDYDRIIAASRAQACKLLVILDCDDGCPAERSLGIKDYLAQQAPDVNWKVVLIRREYETWMLTSARSLAGTDNFPLVDPPPNPEAVRGAKEWMARQMGNYRPTLHQAAFTKKLDLILLYEKSDSFRRLVDWMKTLP